MKTREKNSCFFVPNRHGRSFAFDVLWHGGCFDVGCVRVKGPRLAPSADAGLVGGPASKAVEACVFYYMFSVEMTYLSRNVYANAGRRESSSKEL